MLVGAVRRPSDPDRRAGSSCSPLCSSARSRCSPRCGCRRSGSARSRSAPSSSAPLRSTAANNLVVGRVADRLGPIWPLLAALGCVGPRRRPCCRGRPTSASSSPSLVVVRRRRVRHALHAGDDAAHEARPRNAGSTTATRSRSSASRGRPARRSAPPAAARSRTRRATPCPTSLLSVVCALTLARLWPARLRR